MHGLAARRLPPVLSCFLGKGEKIMRFTKMQAYGNDYVYIDAIHQDLNNLPELARFVSDRHFAIGSDGMVLICPSEKGDFRMRMFNPDGSEGEMCGNALRSVGKYVYDHRLTDKTELVIETLGGMQHLNLFVEGGYVANIRADIGEPRLDTKVIPVNTTLPGLWSSRCRCLTENSISRRYPGETRTVPCLLTAWRIWMWKNTEKRLSI